ncbi:MAG: phage major capsid protein [Alphaproteobacteria bacterium]|nr:phage major capsid protein [Alphaproteobacteria bacterium]
MPNRGIQDCREAIAAAQQALLKADGTFFTNLANRYQQLSAKSQHPADFRRLRGDVAAWANTFINRDGWNATNDQAAYDGVMAWVDMIDNHIERLVVAGDAVGDLNASGASDAVSGWVNAETGQPVRLFGPQASIRAAAGPFRDPNQPTLGAILTGILLGPKTDAVRNALSTGTDSAGGYAVPTFILPEFIDRLRAATQFVKAGARTLILEGQKVAILRTETDPAATWRAENDAFNVDDPSFSRLDFHARSLGVLVKVPYEMIMDAVNIDAVLVASLIGALSVELDRACFFGSGTGNEPLGLYNTPGINEVSLGTNGAVPSSYDPLVDMLFELENDNVTAPTAAVWNPRTARTFRKLKDSTGQPLEAPAPIDTMPMLSTTSFPTNQTQGTANNCSTVIMGDFGQAILGIREHLTITRLDQTFAANGQVGFLARMRADVGFAHSQSFCRLVGVKP